MPWGFVVPFVRRKMDRGKGKCLLGDINAFSCEAVLRLIGVGVIIRILLRKVKEVPKHKFFLHTTQSISKEVNYGLSSCNL